METKFFFEISNRRDTTKIFFKMETKCFLVYKLRWSPKFFQDGDQIFFFEISNRRDTTKIFLVYKLDGDQIFFQDGDQNFLVYKLRWRPKIFFLLFDFQFIFELKI